MKSTNINRAFLSKHNNSNCPREKKFHIYLLLVISLAVVFVIIYNLWLESKCFLLERSTTTRGFFGEKEAEEMCKCDPSCDPKKIASRKKTGGYELRYIPESTKPFEDFPDTNASALNINSELYPLMPIKNRILYREGFHNTWVINKRNILRQRMRPFNLDDISVADHKLVYEIPRAAKTYCEIALLHSKFCEDFESAGQCILRIGAKKLELSLPIRCSKSGWFQNNFINVSNNNNNNNNNNTRTKIESSSAALDGDNLVISSGLIFDSQKRGINPPAYIPKGERPFPKIVKERKWDSNCVKCVVHRLPMAIPEEAIAEKVERNKLFDWNPMTPSYFPHWLSKKSGYSLGRQDEVVNRELQSRSFFSWTHRRGCWSAQRHLDILAAGSVPFFPDLLLCKDPDECLPGYPVELVKRALNLPGVRWLIEPDYRPERRFHNMSMKKPTKYKYDQFPAHHFVDWGQSYNTHPVYNIKRPGIIDHTKFNITEYFYIAEELLAYTKRHLTTKALAAYFLRRMGMENAKRVFGTSHWWLPNTVGLIHGLTALGVEVVVNSDHGFPAGDFNSTEEELAIQRNRYFFAGFRGAGHLYGMRADSRMLKVCERDVNCTQMIMEKKFDLYFYCISGDLNKALYYEELVRNSTPANHIAFVDGLDQGNSFCTDLWNMMCGRGHVLFTRETFAVKEYIPPQRTAAEAKLEPAFPHGLDLEAMI